MCALTKSSGCLSILPLWSLGSVACTGTDALCTVSHAKVPLKSQHHSSVVSRVHEVERRQPDSTCACSQAWALPTEAPPRSGESFFAMTSEALSCIWILSSDVSIVSCRNSRLHAEGATRAPTTLAPAGVTA